MSYSNQVERENRGSILIASYGFTPRTRKMKSTKLALLWFSIGQTFYYFHQTINTYRSGVVHIMNKTRSTTHLNFVS